MARPKRKIELGEKLPKGLIDLGEGRFRCRGPGPDGTSKLYSTRFKAETRRDLDDTIEAFRVAARKGAFAQRDRAKFDAAAAPSRTTTLSNYAERWLRNRRASGAVGPKVMLRYSQLLVGQIEPALGAKMLGDISAALINDAVAGWRTMPRRDNKQGHLSARAIHHALATLTAILESAIDEDILLRNPAKKISVRKSDAREIPALSAAQVAELLAGLRETLLKVPTLVAIGTGLRRGELLGLRWSDVDFEAKVLHVRHSLERLPNKTLRFKEPKTRNSRRSVPLGASIVAALEAHRFEQAHRGLHFGPTFNADRLVFPWVDGTPWNPDDFSMRFYRAIRKMKLPLVSVHGLRHTHASLGLAAGVPMKIVSETLGHADISITANRYTHSLPAQHVESMALIDAALVAAIDKHGEDESTS